MTIYSMINEPLKPGDTLQGRYVITEVYRLSGMSALYLADGTEGVARSYAIKEAIFQDHDELLLYDPVREFEYLGAALMQVNYHTIPMVYDYFTDGNHTYLVTEFIQGNDLETLVNQTDGFLPVRQVYEWGMALSGTLAHLHTSQPDPIVYRDTKPANIMINSEGAIWLVDFGIAVVQTDPPRTYPPLGTDGYAAPEQYVGDAHPLIDMYGLGATLHHLLSGCDPRLEPPFSFAQRPIRQYNPAVPEPLADIVMRALAYSAWDRFTSMRDMQTALEDIRLLFN